ncbi:MAG: Ig domain-containing protein [Bryobacterales bacterium]
MTWRTASRTIEYTPGQYMLTVLNTDAPFSSSSGSVVSGAAPTGVEVYFNCINSDSRWRLFQRDPTGSGVTTITLHDAGRWPHRRHRSHVPTCVQSDRRSNRHWDCGGFYNSSLSTSGGTSPFSWSISSGALPPGLSIDSSSGLVSGTPTASGTYNFTVQVIDSTSLSKTSNQSIEIYDALTVTTTSLPDTSLGGSYSQTLTSSGGAAPKTWSIAYGGIPAGLSLNPSTGVISGVPSFAGLSSFTVQVDCCGSGSAQQALTILVNPAPSITTSSLAQGVVGASYSQTLAVTDGTARTRGRSRSGALPAGLELESGDGRDSGTLTTAGTASFTIGLSDAASATDSQALSIEVLQGPSITTSSFSAATVGQSISVLLEATNGTTPYTWSIISGALPAGLALNTSTGAITGSPTTAETASFTAQVSDANSVTDTKALTWTVNAAPSITTSTLPETTVGAPYSSSLAATGGTGALTWSIASGALPAGVTLNPTTGALTGTPTAEGTASFTVKAADTNSIETTKALSIVVNPAPSITTASLPFGVTTVAYSQTLAEATGGTAPLSWSIASGALLAGLTLNPSTGAITGTPAVTNGDLTLRVSDARSVTDDLALTIEVYDQPQITTTSPLDPLTVGQTVSQTFAAVHGSVPYTWGILSGTLPDGLTLDASTGVVTGVPAAEGVSSFTVQVADTQDLSDADPFTWTVNAAPEITTELPESTVNHAFGPVTMAATGGTGALSWSATGLPAGVSVNPTTGVLSGTPTETGTFVATFTAEDVTTWRRPSSSR